MKRLLFALLVLMASCSKDDSTDEEAHACECEQVHARQASDNKYYISFIRLCELNPNEKIQTDNNGKKFMVDWSYSKTNQVSSDQGCR